MTRNEYLYDGDHLLMEQDVNGNWTDYTYYPGVDAPHSMRRGGSTYYYANEAPGSVTGLMDAAGGLVNDYRYTPWGQREAGTREGVVNPLQYAGRHYEPHAGIYHMRARWYDPHLGRFLSEDPIGLAGGINPYAYANNSPVNARDPSGLVCWIELQYTGWSRGCDVGSSGGSLGFFGYSGITWAGPPPGPGREGPFLPVAGSSCDRAVPRCQLYTPLPHERRMVLDALTAIDPRIGNGFCHRIQGAGVEQFVHGLFMIGNIARDISQRPPYNVILGNAPNNGRPLMYLLLPEHQNDFRRTVVHEAVHAVVARRLRDSGTPVYYTDYTRTQFGTMDQTADRCLGR